LSVPVCRIDFDCCDHTKNSRKSGAHQEPARVAVKHGLPVKNHAADAVLGSQHSHILQGIAIDDDEVLVRSGEGCPSKPEGRRRAVIR
jgi:hypothetical protein